METISKIGLFFDLGNITLSLLATVASLMVVMKTEKELKKAFEYFFVSFVVIFLSGILGMNKYFNVVSNTQIQWVLVVSRFMALLCSTKAALTMLGIVKKQIQCKKLETKKRDE